MESPLTQQLRPDKFEPKIVQLYLYLFNALVNGDDEDETPSEGFWREFFLLKPDKQRLAAILEPMTASDTLHIQTQSQAFFQRAISEAGSGVSPRNENALENLIGFLNAVLAKRYTNPSTDVIEVLAGLDAVDKLVSELVHGLEAIIRQSSNESFRHKAIQTSLSMVSGAYQTTLVTYFTHRDLFPALMKYTHDNSASGSETLVLLGLLANYNKFESQNLYQNRLEDFVNEGTIGILVRDFTSVCATIRDRYVAIHDDSPTPWTITSTLNLVGLRALTPDAGKPAPTPEEDVKVLLNGLPGPEASAILSAYSFVQANKIFAAHLMSLSEEKSLESPFSVFLSATSYIAHNAHRGTRPSHYAILCLLIIRMLVEDPVLAKRISSSESSISVRLCRQRPPHLPSVTTARTPAAVILDICTDIMSHNLRKRLDVQLYSLSLGVILRVFTHLANTKTRLQHHWTYIWGSLLSLLRFLTQYAGELRQIPAIRTDICTPLANLLAFSLSRGDAFLPTPASYDDLFYKLIEGASILPKFKMAYCSTSDPTNRLLSPTNALLSVSTHYQELLKQQHGGKKVHQSPAAIQQVIKEGYDTLQLGEGEDDFGSWDRWRESACKAEVKKIVRTAVEDARGLAMQ